MVRGALPTRAVSWIPKQVNAAGRPDGMTVDTVLADMLKWAVIVVPLAVFVLVQGMAFIALLALFIPLGKLTGDVKRRKEQIDQDLPSFMDVLAVTVTAGIGFRRALRTVSERYGGPLADEIQLTLQHIDNGASMRQAFTALRDRTGSAAVDEFVSAYVQSEELGAPLVDTLNHIAADMRRSSAQAALQRASRIEPRVSLVTTTVMVPGILVLLIGGLLIGTGMLHQISGMFK